MSLLDTRLRLEAEEDERLAPWATRSAASRGRVWPEPEHPYRTVFQRDRDRVVHSTAFRRLQYKTQVFVYHEGDHYRNRLTHSIEGAQISRVIARALRLNEDLAETIALAHDLGHTPFGHAGERVLDRMLASEGGFDHNRQGLRVVDLLEQRKTAFAGLNLSDEAREGILKHGCNWSHPVRLPELRAQRSFEAQIADVSDEIAYTNHDLDDALRSGLIGFEMLSSVPLAGDAIARVDAEEAGLPEPIRRAQVIRTLINGLVTDLIESSHRRIEKSGITGPGAVRDHRERIAGFSPGIEADKRTLKAFLYENFYNHPRVQEMTRKAEGVVDGLFGVFRADPGQLPESVRARFDAEGDGRAIADYVAGMTDRFAQAEYRKRLEPGEPAGV
jgi:dGTPase